MNRYNKQFTVQLHSNVIAIDAICELKKKKKEMQWFFYWSVMGVIPSSAIDLKSHYQQFLRTDRIDWHEIRAISRVFQSPNIHTIEQTLTLYTNAAKGVYLRLSWEPYSFRLNRKIDTTK